MKLRRTIVLVTGLFAFCSSGNAQDEAFDTRIAPLLTEHCIDCHSGLKPKGKLDLTRKTSATKVLADGILWKRVDAGEMPPKKPLGDKEKVVLKKWLDAGAVWGSDPIDPFRMTTSKRAGYDWWAFQAIRRPTPPDVRTKTGRAIRSIDSSARNSKPKV